MTKACSCDETNGLAKNATADGARAFTETPGAGLVWIACGAMLAPGILMNSNMNGQWLGKYTGTSSGSVVLNIDDVGTCFQGIAYVIDDDKSVPRTAVGFRTDNKAKTFDLKSTTLWAIHPQNGNRGNWEEIKQFFPGFVGASNVAVEGQWDDHSLSVEWRTDNGGNCRCELPRSHADQPSDIEAKKMDWAGFKHFVSELRGSRYLFRGQGDARRLRTAFHRTGRADLVRFIDEDIQSLHRRFCLRTRHVFNLRIPDENGAFFNLVQHHGYPTPLLDWTYSPYVAAFFAYRKISRAESDPNKRIRIFVLDQRWRTEIQQIMFAERAFPHFSIGEFMAIENERSVPQQSVSAITNVDDIETYIHSKEIEIGGGRPYLSAIDLPAAERELVFSELAYMGVTAGSLFPGFDGTCEELREQNFR